MTEKPEEQMPSTSGETKEVKELFDLKNFPHILDSDEEDFKDFEEADREKDPEYFLMDEQVDEAFREMSDMERQYFLELKQFHQADYLQRGQIRPLSEYIRELMKWLKPGIPTQTQEIQELLRDKLLKRARTKSELRERGEIPEEKPKMKRVRTTYLGPSTIEEKQADGTIVIKVLPDKDVYEDLIHEEDEVIDMTAMESASEEDPDEESADDLSIVTVDSLANIDKDQIRELWQEMSETKAKEANIYNRLSNMVEEMSPAIIQETISKTPKPGSNIPACVEDLFKEVGSAAVFKRIVACGYMIYEDYMASKDPNYQKLSLWKVIKKFQTDSKGLLQMRRGEAYAREKKKTERMVKQEQKLELKPKKSEKYQASAEETIHIPGLGGIQVREEDLLDEELFSTEQEVEDEPLGGADDAQGTPETSKKRKREDE